jgi:hypothetical protein
MHRIVPQNAFVRSRNCRRHRGIRRIANFVPEQRSHRSLVHRLNRDDVRLVSTTRPIATLFISRMVLRMTAKAS